MCFFRIHPSLPQKKPSFSPLLVGHEDQGISSHHLQNDQNPHHQQPTSKKATKATKSASKLTICCAEEARQLLQLLLRDVLSLNRFGKGNNLFLMFPVFEQEDDQTCC